MRTIETQVAVIGGGATGAGVFRDCALRGVPCVLLEKDDLAAGASGRNHGLLHSGGRYAVKDTLSAMECILENRILRRIASHCVEDTGGLFVTLPEDDPEYHRLFLAACEKARIPVREISVKQALAMEPNVNPAITAAAHVPDGTIDPFRLIAANVMDGVARGGTALTHTEAAAIHSENGRITGLSCVNKKSGEQIEIKCPVIVNAAGVFGQKVCGLAGVTLSMLPSKGSMVIIDYRVNNVVINRCRKPADGDIFVPGDTVSLIGTTSRTIAYEDIEKLTVDDDEINVLLEDGEKLIPNVSRTRVLRAYAGVRPLVAPDKNKEGRDVSRGIVLLDHGERDGLQGLITIAGGKLTTYRLMAEEACDLVCRLLGVSQVCETHLTPLPGSEKKVPHKKTVKDFSGVASSVVGATHFRHGEKVHEVLSSDPKSYGLVCECEMVTSGEVSYALDHLIVTDILDLRRRTRLGMGPCQGALCAFRSAGIFNAERGVPSEEALQMLRDFLEERFKGIKPVLWGDALRETEFSHWLYQGLFGMPGCMENKGSEEPGPGEIAK